MTHQYSAGPIARTNLHGSSAMLKINPTDAVPLSSAPSQQVETRIKGVILAYRSRVD
jgi:hypothetical protein